MVSHFARFPTVYCRCREVNINYAKHFLCWVWSSSFAGRPESRYYPKLTFFQNSCWLSCRGIKNERTKTWSKLIITTHANIYRYRCRKELTGIHSLGPWGTLSIWSVPFVRASNSMCVSRVYLSVLTAEEICLVYYPCIGDSFFTWNWCCLLSLLKGHIGRQITHNHCINNWDSFGSIFGWLGGSSIHIRSICWLFAVIQWFLNFIKICYG